MRLRETEERLRELLNRCSVQDLICTPSEALVVVRTLYRDERVDGCAVESDSDMLLFQWGTYDWGRGPAFEVDFTRQFITNDEEIATWQLSLTFRFAPDDKAIACGEGNRWCYAPADLEPFEQFVRDSQAMKTFGNRRDVKPAIRFTAV
jgi:hypothetical protein